MKLLRYLPFVFIVLGLDACTWGVPEKNATTGITKDTLVYTWQTIKQLKPGCANKTDSNCILLLINYPVFAKDPILNDTLQKEIINYFDPSNHISHNSSHDITLAAKKYADDYKIIIKDAGLVKPNYVRLSTQVIRQDSNLLIIRLNDEGYVNGSKPDNKWRISSSFLNFDINKNKKVLLKDILIPGYLPKLNSIAEPIFRKNEKLSDTTSLKHDYFFEDGKFTVYDNFSITPLGLRFLYNPMDIKPAAAGQTDLVIPYSKIKSLLLPHTVVSQYIK